MRCSLLLPLPLLSTLILFSGCGDDTSSGPNGLLVEEAREVLTLRLEAAYEEKDAADFEALLHPDFRFTFLEGEAPSGSVEGAWGKTTEGWAMLSLFQDESIRSIDFEISIPDEELTVVEGTGEYDYRASTVVGWMVTAVNAGKTNDTLVVAAIHTYHLRKDPAGGAFKIYDQVENAIASGDAYFGSGVDFMSWGELKGMYAVSLIPPAARTIKGTVTADSSGTAMEGVRVAAGEGADTTDGYGRFEMRGVAGAFSVAFTHAGMNPKSVALSGGDEVVRLDVAMTPLSFHETPGEAVTVDLPLAYNRADSTLYALLLDSRYRFHLLPQDVDPNDPNDWWELAEELKIAGNMFNARYNDDGQRVDRIRLDQTERSTTPIVDSLPDQPGGETWYEVVVFVDLLVVVEDPLDPEGVVNFIVASDQIFVVRPYPGQEGRYLIYSQEDRQPINKAPVPDTEESTWGMLKSLFR